MASAPVSQIEDDEAYESSADEDFNPDALQPEIESSSSSSEEAAPTRTSRIKTQRRKRKHDDDDIDADFDSGDEKIVQERQSKRRKKDAGNADFSDDEGGEGGFVKTRSQRRTEQQERRPLARIDGATVDVDALWQKLSSMPIGRPPEIVVPALADNPDDYIVIKRSTTFAGEVTTDERRVLKSSAEARIYLAEQEAKKKKSETDSADQENSTAGGNPNDTLRPLRRPKKRPSRFEPNPTGEVKGLPPQLQLRWPRDRVSLPEMAGVGESGIGRPLNPATRLNTVQKSKYDWANFKDKAGLTAELDEYGKSKQSYAGRQGFLNRAAVIQEEQRRQAKSRAA